MPRYPNFLRYCLLALCLSMLGACSSILRNPVPEDTYQQVTVLGRADLRFWGDQQDHQLHPVFSEADPAVIAQRYGDIMHTEHHYLAISGGGADGAYGAGVLKGWSETGTRPEFTMVTGISTGALTAPFAFLGSAYDQQLQELYTTLDSSSIFNRRNIFTVLRGDSVADNAPLSKMLDKYITDDFIARIAHEYRRGRSLHIGTTHLDAGRPVIWNIGRIADSGHPDAPALVRQILLASAAIPGVFPPAYIAVQGPDGSTYKEMHVDGGTSAQMFLYPSRANWRELMRLLDVQGRPTAYLIRNSRLVPEYKEVRARVPDIAARSVASLIRTQGIGDIYRIAAISHRDDVDVKLTWIPLTAIRDPGKEVFDPQYMSAMFEYGYQRTLTSSVWNDVDINKLTTVAD
ncbi:MAG: patatin-like phospholipase family protein [Halioglobus sp.]